VIKKLTRHGNSLALVIDKPILELLKITRDTPLEITTDGQTLTISPSRPLIPRQLSTISCRTLITAMDMH
jgi:antitoxin component of MazEF toxin-antitoxin module